MDEKQRAQLLSLGIDPDTGRKIRADKGKERGKYSKRDEATAHATPMHVYKRVIARMRAQDQERVANDLAPLIGDFDENGFFIVIPAAYDTVGQHYKQVVKGRIIEHQVRRVRTQKEIDLEKYRFEALAYMATSSSKDEPMDQLEHVRVMLAKRYGLSAYDIKECLARRKITWYEFFCEFYYLDEREATLWNYETWRAHYEIMPKETLPEDFKFDLYHAPGTPEFMPHLAYRKKKLEQLEVEARQQERERKRLQFLSNMGVKPSGITMSDRELRDEVMRRHKKEAKNDTTLNPLITYEPRHTNK